jgi:hypothetical protein
VLSTLVEAIITRFSKFAYNIRLVPLRQGEIGLTPRLQVVEVVRGGHPAWHLTPEASSLSALEVAAAAYDERQTVRFVLSDGERTISMALGSNAQFESMKYPDRPVPTEPKNFLKEHPVIDLTEYVKWYPRGPLGGWILVLEDYDIHNVPIDGKVIGLPGGGVPVEWEEAPVVVAPEPEARIAGVRCAGAKWRREDVTDIVNPNSQSHIDPLGDVTTDCGGDAARRSESVVIQSLGLVVLWVAGDVVLWDYWRGGGSHARTLCTS